MATQKLFTGLLKWDIMCLFDYFFNIRDILIETFYNILIIFLRMAPIFTSRMDTGTLKLNDFFFEIISSIQSRLVSFYKLATNTWSSYPRAHRCAADADCLGRDWERERQANVSFLTNFEEMSVVSRPKSFFFTKKVGRRCILHLLMATRARARCCVRWTASIRTRSTTKARLRWTWPSVVQKSIVCALCSSWTLTRARRASTSIRQSKSCSCLMNIANDQFKK